MHHDQAIKYKINAEITTQQFIDLLVKSTLGERRPVQDKTCMAGMLKNSNLVVSAWKNETLIGIARSMTDFHYACYLSDLAVHQDFQKQGIGKQLQNLTRQQLQSRCKLILISAPTANAYYEKIGFTSSPRCWTLSQDSNVLGE
jgi:ribosomal protein S18 acetylase RimI-like enzyme